MASNGRRGEHRERILALAKKIRADIEAYNRRSPNEPFPIDDTVWRIVANDPEHAKTKKRRAPRKRPLTANPGVFTVKDMADRLGTTVGAWLGERGFEITASDLRTFRWLVAFFQMRFLVDAEPETALPEERLFIAADFCIRNRW